LKTLDPVCVQIPEATLWGPPRAHAHVVWGVG
jgi:hypothetical protein